MKSRNILFIIAHDIGRRYGCYDNGQVKTPNIDALSEESVQFNNHFCHWPLCGPSRANVFSGCRPLTTERYDNDVFFPKFRKRMGDGFVSLPEIFKGNGYRALGAGVVYHDVDDGPSWSAPVWHPGLPDGVPEWLREPLLQSPNIWSSDESFSLIRSRLDKLKSSGMSEGEIRKLEHIRRARGPAVESADVEDEAYHDGLVSRKAVEYLKSLRDSGPFFLAVGFTAGHLPFNSPKKYWDLYRRSALQLPANPSMPEDSPEWAMGDSEPAQYYTMEGYDSPWKADREQSMELLHGAYAAISYIDAQMGKLVHALKENGQWENTVVVVTSDHGFHLGEHGYWGKHNLWDASLEVPLLIRIPGRDDRTVLRSLTEHVDIYPTLCDLCHIPPPGFLEGSSLMPLLEDPETSRKQALFAHRKHMWHDRLQVYDFGHSIRTERYRMTVYLDKRGGTRYMELFDYRLDPHEIRNSAGNPEYGEVRKELTDRLRSGWKASGKQPGRLDG